MATINDTRQNGVREFIGIITLTLSLLMTLALISYQWQDVSMLKVVPNNPPVNYIGPAGAWFGFVVFMIFGFAAALIPVGTGLIGFFLLFKPEEPVRLRIFCWLIIIISSACLIQLYQDNFQTQAESFNIYGLSGGIFGWLLAERFLYNLIGITGASIVLIGILAGMLFLFIGRKPILLLFDNFQSLFRFLMARVNAAREARQNRLERIAIEEKEIAKQRVVIEKAVKKEQRLARLSDTSNENQPKKNIAREDPLMSSPPDPPVKSVAATKKDDAASRISSIKVDPEQPGSQTNYMLPPLSLLHPITSERNGKIIGDVKTTARILKETLAEFGIESDVTNIEQGPVVTRYELLPAPGVRVEKIAQLSNNMALTLKATSVRVQAPIPGKGVVGIEVPNESASKVYLREILEGEAWRNSTAALPLVLGKDVAGNDLVGDLAIMPHLLIAGSTGSGKTVCMNSIIAGFLMSRTPDEMRMMLIDPKIVEFSVYNQLPHLVVPVITDPKKVPLGLRWAIMEMENRYKLFARAGVRNIQSYNTKPKAGLVSDEGTDEPMPERVPYIVIIIDELADLMATSQADIENYIARLAQLSRAVGIHMIIATQRPSVNVITGTIKANFPARISFQVAQKVDSRTILDTGGADKLLGRGDMLILPPGTSKLVRAQGAMTTDEDVHSIVDFIKQRAQSNYEIAIKETLDKGASGGGGSLESDDEGQDEELLNTAVNIIRETRRASVSLLQRRMKIGYNRAGRLMDALENRGIVGPAHGSDPREILIDLDIGDPLNDYKEEDV